MTFIHELLGSWQSVIALIVAALGIPHAWVRLRDGALRVSQRRERHLIRLLRGNKHYSGSVLELQLALRQAFGRVIDDQDFRFSETRHNPLLLLRERLSAGRFIRLNDEKSGYIDARKHCRSISLNAFANLSIVLGTIAFFPLAFFTISAWQEHLLLGVTAAVESLSIEWLLILVSANVDAAVRVLSLENHPPIVVKEVIPASPE